MMQCSTMKIIYGTWSGPLLKKEVFNFITLLHYLKLFLSWIILTKSFLFWHYYSSTLKSKHIFHFPVTVNTSWITTESLPEDKPFPNCVLQLWHPFLNNFFTLFGKREKNVWFFFNIWIRMSANFIHLKSYNVTLKICQKISSLDLTNSFKCEGRNWKISGRKCNLNP